MWGQSLLFPHMVVYQNNSRPFFASTLHSNLKIQRLLFLFLFCIRRVMCSPLNTSLFMPRT